jgi:hypothetical protein
VFFHDGTDWKYIVYYWGEGGSCDGKPYPSRLVGRVARVEVIPKKRVSFAGVKFPSPFTSTDQHSSHDPVGSWTAYRDDYGLEYDVYRQPSANGVIEAGDLKGIIYGPSREDYARWTGCETGW